MKLDELKFAPFYDLDRSYALLTAGRKEDFNTMTISWGGFGTLWNKPVVTVYVKPIRYTYSYMENNDYFTVSFYDDKYKKDLITLGTKSGRDTDKISLTGLNPFFLYDSVTFKEAKVTLLCKKIYYQDMDLEVIEKNLPSDIYDRFYGDDPIHRMYIGEVIDIIK